MYVVAVGVSSFSSRIGLGGLDDLVDEGPDPQSDLLELGREGEVDAHVVPLVDRRTVRRSARTVPPDASRAPVGGGNQSPWVGF